MCKFFFFLGFFSVRQIHKFRPTKLFTCKFGQVFTNVFKYLEEQTKSVWEVFESSWHYFWTQCECIKCRWYPHVSSKWFCKIEWHSTLRLNRPALFCMSLQVNKYQNQHFCTPHHFPVPQPCLWRSWIFSHSKDVNLKRQVTKYIVLFVKKGLRIS